MDRPGVLCHKYLQTKNEHITRYVVCAVCNVQRERVYEMMMNRWMDYGLWTLCDYGAHE